MFPLALLHPVGIIALAYSRGGSAQAVPLGCQEPSKPLGLFAQTLGHEVLGVYAVLISCPNSLLIQGYLAVVKL